MELLLIQIIDIDLVSIISEIFLTFASANKALAKTNLNLKAVL